MIYRMIVIRHGRTRTRAGLASFSAVRECVIFAAIAFACSRSFLGALVFLVAYP